MKKISSKEREIIKRRFGGKCAYSGTDLESDWQIDHVEPVKREPWGYEAKREDRHNLENMFPVQKIINHYKHSLSLEEFRHWLLGGLHLRLQKAPKNPRTEKSAKRKAYIFNVANYFGITADKPFTGKFYFETIGVGND